MNIQNQFQNKARGFDEDAPSSGLSKDDERSTTPTQARSFHTHMSPAAWLHAQANLAATHPFLRTRTTTLTLNRQPLRNAQGAAVRFGPGLDGGISTQTGFLSAYPAEKKLPCEFSNLEDICSKLPELLRTGRARKVISAVIPGNFETLEQRFLSRAAIVLSSLSHAFYFNHRVAGKPDDLPLPDALLNGWKVVAERLQREHPARVPADDIFNNVRTEDWPPHSAKPMPLGFNYFRLPEEHLSSGLQGAVEKRFAGCLHALCQAQGAIGAGNETLLTDLLTEMSDHVVGCGELMELMSPQVFDAVVWGRTYPEMGRPILPNELGNSGVDAPMFHALDAFLGRSRIVVGELEGQQLRRAKAFPASHQALIQALADPRYSLRKFVKNAAGENVRHAYHVLVQSYAWLLEKHRRKAVGAIGVVLAGGRVSTAGGAKQDRLAAAQMPPVDELINQQMLGALAERTAGCPATIEAVVEKTKLITPKTLQIALTFLTPVPLRAGDRVYVWPETPDSSCPEANGDDEPKAQGKTPEPRAYSVAEVVPKNATSGQIVNLTIGIPEGTRGLSVRYLTSLHPGANVRLQLSPAPSFRLPVGTRAPLTLVGQGAGVGPLFGFLRERAQAADPGQGRISLFVAARRAVEIPYVDELARLTLCLPLTLNMALTQERGRTVKEGMVSHFPTTLRINDALSFESGPIRQGLLTDGHIFVCGSTDFGFGVRAFIEKILRHHAATQTAVESLTRRYHEDLFSPPQALQSGATFSVQDLALHNRPEDLWSSFHGQVYNLTDYARSHPGGPKVLMEVAGLVGDRRFDQIHGGRQSQEVKARMTPYLLGELVAWPLCDAANLSGRFHALLSDVVAAQNTLRNNTYFFGRQGVPLYTITDALLITAEVSLEKVCSQLRTTSALSTRNTSLTEALSTLKTVALDLLVRHGITAENGLLVAHNNLIDKVLDGLESIKKAIIVALDGLAFSMATEAEAIPAQLESVVDSVLQNISRDAIKCTRDLENSLMHPKDEAR